jgi:hypothetical protein
LVVLLFPQSAHKTPSGQRGLLHPTADP